MAVERSLSTLSSSEGFKIIGEAAFDGAGYSLSTAGDINGDGFDDIIIGAATNDANGTDAGAAYVIYGKAGGFGTVDLLSMSASSGFKISGELAGDFAGKSVSTAGDVNGDGLADLIIGASRNDGGGAEAGAAYVLFGRTTGLGDVSLANVTSSRGFKIIGDAAHQYAGAAVASAGDVNGDGFDDILVGAYDATPAGAAYILFGKAKGFTDVDLTNLGTAGVKLTGAASGDLFGVSVSSAGDVNGDGFDDVIVGAMFANTSRGAAYVVFGKASGWADLTIPSTAAQGFQITGAVSGDFAGRSVSCAGDVNGDGYDDVFVGAPSSDPHGDRSGTGYVLFGHAGSFRTIDLSNLSSSEGFRIEGPVSNGTAGYSVSSAGDVNGDGFDDLLIGAAGTVYGSQSPGMSYLIYGRVGGFSGIDLRSLSDSDGMIIVGEGPGDFPGIVSAAGDVNDDGYADILVGAPFNDSGGTDSGAAYVLYGAGPTESVSRVGSSIGQTIRGSAFSDTLDGRGGSDTLIGGGGGDSLIGGTGNDTLNGGSGADTMIGGTGNDTYFVDNAGDTVIEHAGEGADTVKASVSYVLAATLENLILDGSASLNGTGNNANNAITGNAGINSLNGGGGGDVIKGGGANDVLNGGTGNDTLVGGAGIDSLAGGSGADKFVLDSAPGSTNHDSITDFSVADDTIVLDRSIFKVFTANGTLASSAFFTGSAAHDGNDHIIYNSGNGNIYYDPDGNGAGAQVLIAHVTSGLTLTNADFLLVS